MSFDWSGYLTLAKEMINKVDEFPEQEAVYRSVVSRAYYAVFCLTRNYVKDIDSQEFHGNDHQELQNYLTRHSHKIRKKIGNQLRTLQQHRIKADYQDNLDEQAVYKASKAIKLADKITNGLAKIFS
jgi:uncharacterized protein (UPF0332 family)